MLDPTLAPKVTDEPFAAEDTLLLLAAPVKALLSRADPAAVNKLEGLTPLEFRGLNVSTELAWLFVVC